MVAIINSSKSFHRPFNYNENKVAEGAATCIAAEGYPKDLADLSLSNKLNLLLHQSALHKTVERPAIHISLNFDPSDKLTDEKMTKIAADYMQRIGFGGQPYLIYRHKDTAHPHMHIVTTKVKGDGMLIPTQYIGRDKSEPARIALEKKYGLVPAQRDQLKALYRPEPVQAAKVIYSKSKTRAAIQNVLNGTLSEYRYAGLPQLNAVLRQYNVQAFRGSENSRTYKHGGLYYRALQDGEPAGKPIKASDLFVEMSKEEDAFNNKPTLAYLQHRFENFPPTLAAKSRLKKTLNLALHMKAPLSLEQFAEDLKNDKIDTVIRRSDQGLVYGITYVDHRDRNLSVFNGSELGKEYSAAAVMEKCYQNWQELENRMKEDSPRHHSPTIHTSQTSPASDNEPPLPPLDLSLVPNEIMSLLETLFGAEDYEGPVPYEHRLDRKKRKKRKRNNPNDN
ncbi:relaxase/mobilization nuclease domain-containing protein [Olivibacter domesticus]|uniref:Relaxase/Mobilisation nuclease domain-containing protein n=1 Tax=Olivibacter domesticus TaxID=407022 RepID=A0A1H7IEF0_OLID1|nr:relaxase/mobilization nuclease domain-containing protein [Olivibacter domesticus]SEK60953.1 Relaxase/Mobilisation nuclease domain-containing protein [Olivibacter domesticus]